MSLDVHVYLSYVCFQSSLFPSHASRDEGARNEEKKGIIEFHVIGNTLSRKPSRQLLIWLIGRNSFLRLFEFFLVTSLCTVNSTVIN